MTVNELQRSLIREIECLSKDMSLLDKNGKKAVMKGYPQSIPVFPMLAEVPYGDITETEMDEPGLFPYFVVRVSDVEYKKKEAEYQNQAHVIVAFAIYDEDPELKGYFSLCAVMERVIMRFQTNTALDAFYCDRTMSTAFQEDDTYPQFFGAVEMTWNLPDIEMEDWNE